MRKLFILLFFVVLVSPAYALLVAQSPAEVCSVLDGSGLSTHGWTQNDGDDYFCASNYKQLGSGHPIPNNMAFYAEGTADAVDQAKLALNVNDQATSTKAQKSLLQAASVLFSHLTGKTLGSEARNAIRHGKNFEQIIGDVTLDVIRRDFQNGNGYAVKVLFK